MNRLNTEELRKLKGGFGSFAVAGLIALGIFIVGVFDGISRPLKCN